MVFDVFLHLMYLSMWPTSVQEKPCASEDLIVSASAMRDLRSVGLHEEHHSILFFVVAVVLVLGVVCRD